jgi:DNA primase
VIPDDVIEEVRARADLVELVGEVVPLRRAGKDYKGKCPFHEDRTPSFFVVPAKGIYHCFGCGAKGDAFRFLMERQGLGFLDAVRALAERYGVPLREVTREAADEDPLRPLAEVNAFARHYFQRCLLDPELGAEARAYLERRGIGADIWERFGLGWAPEGWHHLRDAARTHGIEDARLLEVGLLNTSEHRPEPYDRFRGRIMFPIESVTGRVIAFGGRVIGEAGKGVPKYMNSPESPLYHKGETLYALGWNRHAIRKEGSALVTEGYMDVVSLGAAGVDHAIATLGTALTPEQARLLHRYAAQAILLFDADEAGLRATFRGADVLLAEGIQPLIATLPPGEDPDSLVRSGGAKALRAFLDQAVDVMDRKLQLLAERGFFEDNQGTRTAIDKLLPTLRATRDPTLRDIYVARVSTRTGVRRETLEEALAEAPPPSRPSSAREASSSGPPPRQERRGRRPITGLGPERQLLLVLLRTRGWAERAAERIGPEEFRDPVYRAIFEWLLEDPEPGALPPAASPEVLQRLEALQGDPEVLEFTERVFEQSLEQLMARGVEVRRMALLEALRAATDPEEESRIASELQRLRQESPGRWNVVRRTSSPAPLQDHQRTDA